MSGFQGKQQIIESLLPLTENMRFVTIDREKLSAFCSHLHGRHFLASAWDQDFIYPPLDKSGIDYFLVFNSINFCYWGSPKWTVTYRDHDRDGAWGMLAALTRALEEEHPILEGDYLAGLTQGDLTRILRGNVTIPLFPQRLNILREAGKVLAAGFEGHFHHLLEAAEGSAVKLVNLLVENFPSFDDSVDWEGHHLLFYKRAQLGVAMLGERWHAHKIDLFGDLDQLTVSADYKLPQVLRNLEILKYAPPLARMIDEKRRIPANSREELEIRAATIMAGEIMTELLQKRIKGVTPQHVDRLIWLAGQKKTSRDKPYHRTLTIAY